MHTPGRGDDALRRHRVSVPNASYFLTLCTVNRAAGLSAAAVAPAVRLEIDAIEADRHGRVCAGAIMPDHLHLLIQFGSQLPLGRCIARLKAKTNPAISAVYLTWQTNFYERRLRPDDVVETVIRYLFLNPSRAGLRASDESYPHFWMGAEESSWFPSTTGDGKPFPEWLR